MNSNQNDAEPYCVRRAGDQRVGQFFRLIRYAIALCIAGMSVNLTGCTTSGKLTADARVDPDHVRAIGFRIRLPDPDAGTTRAKLNLRVISKQISERFARAGYPVIAMGRTTLPANQSGEPKTARQSGISHLLEASFNRNHQTSTPSGFSFGLGNSDPRARSFQKVDVIEITCRMIDLESPQNAVTLVEQKAWRAVGEDGSELDKSSFSYYVDSIGATCHNLLAKLEIYPRDSVDQGSDQADEKSSRQEIERGKTAGRNEKPEKSRPELVKRPTKRSQIPSGAREPVALEKSAPVNQTLKPIFSNENSSESSNQRYTESKPLRLHEVPLEESIAPQQKSWRRATKTIFNQGDPVTLKFGYERR